MKSFVLVLIITSLFLGFGIKIQSSIEDFTSSFNRKLDDINNQIENNDLNKALELSNNFTLNWKEESKSWYYLLDHEYFDDVYFYSKVLTNSIKTNDITNSLEYIEKIKMAIDNIIQYEKLDLDHIL